MHYEEATCCFPLGVGDKKTPKSSSYQGILKLYVEIPMK
jgi:hypothetical protein